MAARPTLICLTPVKNEAWILDRFLRGAGLWADHIVVVDHQSDDGSREIAARHPKVTLVPYDRPSFDEPERRRLLIETARTLGPADRQRILLSVDADEALTDWTGSAAWKQMGSAAPGTTIQMQWANVLPGGTTCWLDKVVDVGYVDDGRPFSAPAIHGPRLPANPDVPPLRLDDVHLLHYQYVDWARMKSKQRWYQAWERVQFPQKRAVTLYRQYHQMDAIKTRAHRPVPDAWLAPYTAAGIDLTQLSAPGPYQWDQAIVELLLEHGPASFRKLNIWDVDWGQLGRDLGYAVNGELADPRSRFDRAVHRWLHRTQPRMTSPFVRLLQQCLRVAGW